MRLLHCLGAALALPGLALAADLNAQVRDAAGAPLADAVVVAVPQDARPMRRPAHPRVDSIEQVHEEFVPRVKPVLVGTAVSFPNRDHVRHHVYSFSPAKRFELPLYAGTPAKPVVFDKAGVVVLGCNIHDWMIGYVYVSESPYFAKTGSDGRATLSGLPAGRYVLRAWHPRLAVDEAATRREVDLETGRDPDLEWRLPLKPYRPVRRPPDFFHGAHY